MMKLTDTVGGGVKIEGGGSEPSLLDLAPALPIGGALGPQGWPRVINDGRWFAWRPVRLEEGGWRWLTMVHRYTWAHRAGDWMFQSRSYRP